MGFFQSHSFQQNVLLADGLEDLQLVPLTKGTFLPVLRSRLPKTFIFTLPTEHIKINQSHRYLPTLHKPNLASVSLLLATNWMKEPSMLLSLATDLPLAYLQILSIWLYTLELPFSRALKAKQVWQKSLTNTANTKMTWESPHHIGKSDKCPLPTDVKH